MKKIIFAGLCMTLFFFIACEKNDLNKNKIWDFKKSETAMVKFIHAYTKLTPSLGNPFNGPTVDLYVNNVKINGAPMAYFSIFPSTSGTYSEVSVPSGLVNIKVILNRIITETPMPGDTLVNKEFQLEKGAKHSIVLVDTLPNPTPTSPILMVTKETVDTPQSGKFKTRFINLIPSTDILDVYSRRLGGNIATGIVYKNISDWVELPVFDKTDTLELRKQGSLVSIVNLNSFTGTNQRSYTIIARGNTSVAGKPIILSSFATQ